jgi:predicted neuraminidase
LHNQFLSANLPCALDFDARFFAAFSLEAHVLMARLGTVVLVALWSFMASAQSSGGLIFAVGSTSFPSSHASTIVELKDGSLMAAWFGGTDEGSPDVAIWTARRTATGWSAPVELAREPKVPCWNPVLFHSRDGRLWFYYKFGPNPLEWAAARRYSLDEGRTWSPVERLPAGILRAKPLVPADGTIVSGTSFESYLTRSIWVERSTNNGETWTKIGPILPALHPGQNGLPDNGIRTGLIQPSVVALGKGRLRLYARSTPDIARICVADSFDDGQTWTRAHALDVANPNSGIDAVALRDGRVVLVYNDSTTERTPLNLAVSRDGEHFKNFKVLESEPGEYSYPAIIENARGDLDLTYTWNRKSIKYVHIPLAEVPK